jgi:hypothetical protein
MSFRMEVRIDEVLEEGAYKAVLENAEEKDTKFGERLMWTFDLPEQNAQVVGFTSMSPSTRANAYRWAEAIMGQIDPKSGWGPEDVIGGECIVVLEVAEEPREPRRTRSSSSCHQRKMSLSPRVRRVLTASQALTTSPSKGGHKAGRISVCAPLPAKEGDTFRCWQRRRKA